LTLWLKVRRAQLNALGIIGVVTASVAASDILIPMPGLLTGTGLAVPLPAVAPLLVAITLALGLSSTDPILESTSVQRLRALDAVYAAGVAGLVLIMCWMCAAVAGAELALAAGRNAVGYTGMMLLGARMLGRYAAPLVPAGMILFLAIFGADASGQPRWWAWPLRATGEFHPWAVAVGLILVGLLAWLIGPRRNALPH
jgi:hypothetical protein